MGYPPYTPPLNPISCGVVPTPPTIESIFLGVSLPLPPLPLVFKYDLWVWRPPLLGPLLDTPSVATGCYQHHPLVVPEGLEPREAEYPREFSYVSSSTGVAVVSRTWVRTTICSLALPEGRCGISSLFPGQKRAVQLVLVRKFQSWRAAGGSSRSLSQKTYLSCSPVFVDTVFLAAFVRDPG